MATSTPPSSSSSSSKADILAFLDSLDKLPTAPPNPTPLPQLKLQTPQQQLQQPGTNINHDPIPAFQSALPVQGFSQPLPTTTTLQQPLNTAPQSTIESYQRPLLASSNVPSQPPPQQQQSRPMSNAPPPMAGFVRPPAGTAGIPARALISPSIAPAGVFIPAPQPYQPLQSYQPPQAPAPSLQPAEDTAQTQEPTAFSDQPPSWSSWASWGNSILTTAKAQATSTLTKVSEKAKNLELDVSKLDVSKLGSELYAITEKSVSKVIDSVAPNPYNSRGPGDTTPAVVLWVYAETHDPALEEQVAGMVEDLTLSWTKGAVNVAQSVKVNLVKPSERYIAKSFEEAVKRFGVISTRLSTLTSSTHAAGQLQPISRETHHPKLIILPIHLETYTQITHAILLDYSDLQFAEHVFSQSVAYIPHSPGAVMDDPLERFLHNQILRTLGCAVEDLAEMVRIVVYARQMEFESTSNDVVADGNGDKSGFGMDVNRSRGDVLEL